MSAEAGLAGRLADLGVEHPKLPDLAADAAKQWTGTFNPRKVGPGELLDLYRAAY
jgi:alcohol dehydrogenase